jgi:hypothetical protein
MMMMLMMVVDGWGRGGREGALTKSKNKINKNTLIKGKIINHIETEY